MSTTDDRVASLRAELELAELEGELAAAKADKKLSEEELHEIKNKVRAARQAYREAREAE